MDNRTLHVRLSTKHGNCSGGRAYALPAYSEADDGFEKGAASGMLDPAPLATS